MDSLENFLDCWIFLNSLCFSCNFLKLFEVQETILAFPLKFLEFPLHRRADAKLLRRRGCRARGRARPSDASGPQRAIVGSMEQLLELGFEPFKCEKALEATGQDVQAAIDFAANPLLFFSSIGNQLTAATIITTLQLTAVHS